MSLQPSLSLAPLWRAIAVLPLVLTLAGCSPGEVTVQETTIAPDEATYFFLVDEDEQERGEYTIEDEQVTLSVRFNYNLVATYYLYDVHWIAPAGHVYLRGRIRTEFGTNRELTTSMRIRGDTPSRMPGDWRVELYLDGRLLTTREFRIVAPDQLCPPLPEPPGRCVDKYRDE